jgi:uncharacterized protein
MKKPEPEIVRRRAPASAEKTAPPFVAPPTVSGRWILGAFGIVVAAAVLCAWGTLCLLFWQGSWQLLYHPSSKITRTPASAGLAFDPVGFAVNDAGQASLRGWWVPATAGAPFGRYTVLYLHGATGNLSDCVEALAALHAAGVNVFAFDYRGYGQSEFVRPSEKRWREDANSALEYLTGTRQVAPDAIVVEGAGLGGNLALETAAAHPELAGAVLDLPLEAPMEAVFGDPRAGLVPAHLLTSDRYDPAKAAKRLEIPSLWFVAAEKIGRGASLATGPAAYSAVNASKMLVWLADGPGRQKEYAEALGRWLGDLPAKGVGR